MKVLVCGSRDYLDFETLSNTLTRLDNELGPFTEIIEGDARGADTLAGIWAKLNRVGLREFPADWRKYGKAAGPIRNKQMLDEGKPDLVIAFPSNGLSKSRGTRNMVEQARKAEIKTIVIGE